MSQSTSGQSAVVEKEPTSSFLNSKTATTNTMNDMNDPHLLAIAPGQLRVIRRNGKVTVYDSNKIAIAMSKAFLAVEGAHAAASTRIYQTVAEYRVLFRYSRNAARRRKSPIRIITH